MWLGGVILAQAGNGPVQRIRGASCLRRADGLIPAGLTAEQMGVDDIGHGERSPVGDTPEGG